MIIWTAGHNMPGYLPEGDVVGFSTRAEALAYTAEELRRSAEELFMGDGAPEDDAAAEYEQAADALEGRDADTDGDWYDTFDGGRIAYWFMSIDATEDEAAELLGGGE